MIVCYVKLFSDSTIAYKNNNESEMKYVNVSENNIVKTIGSLINTLNDTDILFVGNSVFSEKYANDLKYYCYNVYNLNPNELNVEVK